jgi:hypothetical protein
MDVIYPEHYRIFKCWKGRWSMLRPETFYGLRSSASSLKIYQLSAEQIAIALFRINGGKAGYYLANIRDRKYYYCGIKPEDVKATLRSLGIGRDDPMEKADA